MRLSLVEYHLLQAMLLHTNILIRSKIFLVTQFAKRTPDDMHRLVMMCATHIVSTRKTKSIRIYEGQWGM